MLKIVRRIDNFALFFITVIFLGTIGCGWFPESTFELAGESRLPKWISLPPGLNRSDVSLTMNYYVKPWGSSATFILRDRKGQVLTKIDGKVNNSEPVRLKHSPPGFPAGYPSYEVVTVKDMTEIIEHRKMEPIFYVTDDPVVRKELVENRGQEAGEEKEGHP
jgi:hypothetical protein